MRPDDQSEIASVQLRAWDEVVREFRDAAEMKPAFGWAHELTVSITNRNVPMMVRRYAEEHGITVPAKNGKVNRPSEIF
jgi:hypothetical protein